jgi:hypothetical protein
MYGMLHAIVALALTAPILAFYLVIAGEALGYSQPAERFVYLAPSLLGQICSAMAKDTQLRMTK